MRKHTCSRCRKEEQIPTTQLVKFDTAFHDLCRDCGIASPPRFLWSPLSMWSGGLAFGRVGARYVSLTGGLVARERLRSEQLAASRTA